MPRRNDISKILVPGLGLLMFSACFCAGGSGQSHSDPRPPKITAGVPCAYGQTGERIFANPDAKSWKEYARVEDVPPLATDKGGQMFIVSANAHHRNEVQLFERNEDASVSHVYCYDRIGMLRYLHYEILTDWGWGYSEDRLFGVAEEVVLQDTKFFDIASHKKIPRPRQADDFPNFLKPTIYFSFDSLPFIAAFKSVRVNAP
jgi:hypothetical protein